MTIYPYLNELIEMLKTATGYPVAAAANLETISVQHTSSIFIVPEDLNVLQAITDQKTIRSIRFNQFWMVATVLHNAGDQNVGFDLVSEIGEVQAKIVNGLCRHRLEKGGPLGVIEIPQAVSYAGGFIVGKLRFSTQFTFNAE